MNNYHNYFYLEGSNGDISKIYKWMKETEPSIRQNSPDGIFWFPELVETIGVDATAFSIKCSSIWKYGLKEGGNILEIYADSRGGAALESVWAIEDHYPGVKLWYEYYSTDAGVHHTNDAECKFHGSNYALVLTSDVDKETYWESAWLCSAEQEGKTFKTIEEVAQYASEILGRDVPRDWKQILKELEADGLLVDSSCILDQVEE